MQRLYIWAGLRTVCLVGMVGAMMLWAGCNVKVHREAPPRSSNTEERRTDADVRPAVPNSNGDREWACYG